MPSRPVAGQPDEQAPQVRQRLRIPALGQQLLHLVDEHAFLFTADFDRFFSHSN